MYEYIQFFADINYKFYIILKSSINFQVSMSNVANCFLIFFASSVSSSWLI